MLKDSALVNLGLALLALAALSFLTNTDIPPKLLAFGMPDRRGTRVSQLGPSRDSLLATFLELEPVDRRSEREASDSVLALVLVMTSLAGRLELSESVLLQGRGSLVHLRSS